MVQIADGLRRIHAFQLRREYLRLLMMDEPRVRARDFQHHVRELLDRVQIRTADVVSLAGLEVVRDVGERAYRVGEISRSARVTAENSPRQGVQRAI